jgi:hypothetical protein
MVKELIEQYIRQDTITILPVYTLSNENNFANVFELLTFTLSEYELLVFASRSDFELSLAL